MIFVDTSAWLNLFDERQDKRLRKISSDFVEEVDDKFCTSDLVISECHRWLIQHGRPAERAFKVLTKLLEQDMAIILPIEQPERLHALQLVWKYRDQGLSYTDAASVALMQKFGIEQVFSFDRDFLLFPSVRRVP